MKRLSFGVPTGPGDTRWIVSALKLIERASAEDMQTFIGTDYTITGSFTPTRTLNTSTATLSDLIAFVATLVQDIQKGGQHRTGA